jgi:cell division protein FtsW
VAAEEFGFIGSIVLLGIFAALVLRMFILSRRLADPFGRLLLIGFASLIAMQVVINVGAMTGLLPLTGTPLPFISYGGTSLAVYLTMMGIVINISKYASR